MSTERKSKEEWLKLLKENRANCYIKPTRHKHDSGFRCFEVGYIMLNDKNKCEDKLVLGQYSDHIWKEPKINDSVYEKEYFEDLSMDLTNDGYIRLFTHSCRLWWGSMDWVVSSASITRLN